MKVKKSMFAKLLALALPMAAISVVTPIVLTSCGSSTSETNKQASWDTNKTQDGLTFDTTNNSAVITLSNNAFANTGISKASTFDNIKSSLEPASTGTTLFSVLSGAIKDVGNYDVKLSVDTNPIVFDYSNDAIGNYFNGQFQLTPKSGTNVTAVNLNFRVNNFNDSYYGKSESSLQWDVNKIQNALNSKPQLDGTDKLPNETPKITQSNNGASVTIDLSNQTDKVKGLGHVMDELCKPDSTITSDELKSFITTNNMSNYNIEGAKISNWAPSVDGTMVFTRIVVPNKTQGSRDAILYIAYTGLKKDKGNAAWNRNISYPGNTNLWDSKYNEPIIDLSKVNGNIGDTTISNKSTKEQITDKGTITPFVEYMVKNYMMESGDFKLCFTGIKGQGTGHDTIVPGKFTNGVFTADSDSVSKPSTVSSVKDSTQSNNFDGQAVQLKVWLEDVDNTNSAHNSYGRGIWRAFYLINYSDASKN